MKFFLTYVGLPCFVLFIIYSYVKTILFAYNTMRFFQRFNKKDEKGEFEIPTKNPRRRNLASKSKVKKQDDGFKKV